MSQTKTPKKPLRPVIFDLTSNQCVWAKAGVVKPFQCLNSFDCTGCDFDKKIQKDLQAGRLVNAKGRPAVSWQHPQHWLKLGGAQRKCRHMLSGRVSFKTCARGFDCARCPYDQMIDDQGLARPLKKPAYDLAAGFVLPRDHYFHQAHAWARLEYGGRVRVGWDDFASRLVGPVDEFRLPRLGVTIRQSEPRTSFRRDRNTAELLSPLDGVVVAVNPRVEEKAGTANASPYDEGWLMVVQPTNLKDNLKNLLFGEESQAWMEEEAGRLTALVSQETGYQLAATGGQMVEDIYGAVPEVGWNRLVGEFLSL